MIERDRAVAIVKERRSWWLEADDMFINIIQIFNLSFSKSDIGYVGGRGPAVGGYCALPSIHLLHWVPTTLPYVDPFGD